MLLDRLSQAPVVALLISRQVGKTTLARELVLDKPRHYLDLERHSDLAKLADPELYLGFTLAAWRVGWSSSTRCNALPGLFPVLRSLVDERHRPGVTRRV